MEATRFPPLRSPLRSLLRGREREREEGSEGGAPPPRGHKEGSEVGGNGREGGDIRWRLLS